MSWIQHIKDTQRKHGCSYKEAMGIASGTYKKGSASKTRPGHKDFMAHKGSRSKTHRGLDYESSSDEEGEGIGDVANRAGDAVLSAVGRVGLNTMKYLTPKLYKNTGMKWLHEGRIEQDKQKRRRGGAVGDIPIVPSNVASFGNTNLGVMNVPQAHIPYQVVNASGQTRRPRLRGMRGGGVIDELGNQNYIGQLYNQKDLGANGVVRL